MDIQHSSDDIGRKPDGESPPQAELQATGYESEPSQTAECDSDKNQCAIVNIERDIRGGEKWLIGIGIATVLINSVIALIYWGQLRRMNDTYQQMQQQTKASSWSAYWACLNSQGAQRAANDSNAMANAAIEQAAAGIETERAAVFITTSFPTPTMLLTNELWIPFTMTNEGKGAATNVRARFKAVFLGPADKLHIDTRNEKFTYIQYFGPGKVFPDAPPAPFKAFTTHIQVDDVNGNPIMKTSSEGTAFMNGNSNISVAVIAQISYRDFAGEHADRFCQLQFLMQPGTVGRPLPGQKACFDYYKKDTGSAYSQSGARAGIPAPSLPTITCVMPKD